MDSIPDLELLSLDPDEEEELSKSQAVSKLTQAQLDAFNEWVGPNNPSGLKAKHWITGTNNLDLHMFSASEIHLLTKRAKCIYDNQTHHENKQHKYVVRKPGLGLQLGHMPKEGSRFPLLFMEHNYENGWRAATLLIRESCMLKLVDTLSDKPDWWLKVRDSDIANKWKQEALAMDWKLYREYADFTPAMADACISELRKKADLYEQTRLMPVYDFTTCVIKSDSILTPELAQTLKEAIVPLENVPPESKDWHPYSKNQVLDLVHPSLWPLMYGHSRVLRDRVINLDNALDSCGTGDILRAPGSGETLHVTGRGGFCETSTVVLSNKFQWLPCDVDLNPSTGDVKIASYINNLHPREHAHLYPIIEQFIKKSLPAWDTIYNWEKDFSVQRLSTDEAEYEECPCPEFCDINDCHGCAPWRRPIGEDEEPRYDVDYWGAVLEEEGEDSDDDDGELQDQIADEKVEDYKTNAKRRELDEAWFASTHSVKLPDADPSAENHVRIEASDIKSAWFFDGKKQIQVIVKLANIHLTPKRFMYNGGSWHTEGLLNEHIVSTALYYYDSENITDCTLDFRTCADKEDLAAELSYEQNRHEPIERTFAIDLQGSIFQDIGSVHTKPNRALFFPNVLQHQVSRFQLQDPTKPGHRKILALFLVDPAIPVISTSNVPPQQKHWWTDQSGLDSGRGILPPEIVEQVTDSMEWPMNLDKAKEMRLDLMKERTSFKDAEESTFQRMEWNFCEH
ncbi:Ff.00g060710.m01.CDS01 [Fusarium sp. VM40]|nr:Ff.00g060710.m01.CDS01 [Fusarium sp. VM40]